VDTTFPNEERRLSNYPVDPVVAAATAAAKAGPRTPAARRPVVGPTAAPAAPTAPAPIVSPVDQTMEYFKKLQANTAVPKGMEIPADKTDEQLYADLKARQKLAGVSDDPFSRSRERYEKLEARQKEQESGDATDRMIAQLIAYSGADPTKGLGYQLGVSGTAAQSMKKEQDALRNQQATEMAKLYSEYDKEENARKRGDADGVLSAKNAQQATKERIEKLQIDQQTADSQRTSAGAHALTASVTAANAPEQLRLEGLRTQAAVDQARIAKIMAEKTPAEIQLIQMYAASKGISFAQAAMELKTAVADTKSDADLIKIYNNSPVHQMNYKTFEIFKEAMGGGSGGAASGAAPRDSRLKVGEVLGTDGRGHPPTAKVGDKILNFKPSTNTYE
jgi:hypothetical protein